MTNAEKFKEIFGFEPDTGHCVLPSCSMCGKGSQKLKFDSRYAYGWCHHAKTWWTKEYRESEEENEGRTQTM